MGKGVGEEESETSILTLELFEGSISLVPVQEALK